VDFLLEVLCMPIFLVARLGIRKVRKKTKAAHDQAAILSLEISVAGFFGSRHIEPVWLKPPCVLQTPVGGP
jgi:hypothetical protein